MTPMRQLRPSLAGPDVMGAPMSPPPMEFAPMLAGQGAGPDISPLTSALQQFYSRKAAPSVQKASTGTSKATDAPIRRKQSFAELMGMAAGGGGIV